MKKIQSNIGDNSYSPAVESFFQKAFPIQLSISKANLLDAISELLFGTKEYRLGTLPSPESAVTIREAIRAAIDKNIPIPILVPWGGRKTKATALVDVAEVSAIQRLICVDDFLKQFYPPGLNINIRIEDLGALWLYRNEENITENVEKYANDFSNLVNILSPGHLINPIKEGSLMNGEDYFIMAAKDSKLIFKYLLTSEANGTFEKDFSHDWKQLEATGWKGKIPQEQREYYTDRYKSLYPGLSHTESLEMLSDYLAGAKVRYDLKGRAAPIIDGEKFIQITFVPPVPGAPENLFSNSLYYRTVGLSNARTHIAPWRAKGYLELNANGNVKTKLTSWNDAEKISELISGTTELNVLERSVTIQSDILITN